MCARGKRSRSKSIAKPELPEYRNLTGLTTASTGPSPSLRSAVPSTSRKESIRLLVVGDHPIVRTGLRLLIERHRQAWVVEETGNRPEDINKISRQPDVIVADLDSSQDHPVTWISAMFESLKESRALVLASNCDQKLCRRLARLGAMGVVSKSQTADFLMRAIERVHAGELWLERATVADLMRGMMERKSGPSLDAEAAKIATLTRREREIIDCVGEGLDVAAIATQLFISETTVRHHLTSILDKLGLQDRFNLAFYAFRHGLAAPPR